MPLPVVLFCVFLYMALLFAVAWWTERQTARGRNIVRHPVVYSLSLAIYCTAWTFFGSVGRASTSSLSFLAIYLGPTLVAPLWWLILRKMIVISKHQRITSIADFISARYGKSSAIAAVATLMVILGIVPYLAIQLKAVSFCMNVWTATDEAQQPFWLDIALWTTVVMVIFTILFGARKLDPNERHEGLVAAVAVESLLKLVAFLAVGIFVLYWLYDGPVDLFRQAWERPAIRPLFSLQASGITPMNWHMLLLLSALAMLLLPRQFHMAVVENTHVRHVTSAMWMFPLYLLLINIFVFPIALAGKMRLPADVVPDTFVLTLPLSEGYEWLAMLVLLGGVSAATSMVITSTTALSIMFSNHLIVPLLLRWRALGGADTGQKLLLVRHFSIACILSLAYIYLKAISNAYDLVSLGLISFAAVAQFAPTALGGMYWRGATQQGAMASMLTGAVLWAYTLPLPALAEAGFLPRSFIEVGPWGIGWLRPYALFGLEGLDFVSHAAFWSLLLNTAAYVIVSIHTRPSALTLTQADVFVQIDKYVAGHDVELVRREADMADLLAVLHRFWSEARVAALLHEYQAQGGVIREGASATTDLINFIETQLAGSIGAASARLVIHAAVKEQPITLDEMMQVLQQTQEVLRYSTALEAKSAELETATRQLTAANEQLKQLDRLKADFITTVTHELRTPVTSIRSMSKILLDYRPELSEEKTTEYLRILVSESERISRLVNQVLDLEKMQSDVLRVTALEKADMHAITVQVISGMEQMFIEKKVRLHLTDRRTNTQLRVLGDADRLIQVVVNLVSNALKFVPAGHGVVQVVLSNTADRLILEVIDNGPGIPPAEQALIFERFTQVSDLRTGKPEGSGLGLFITQTIVHHHQGFISVTSASGEGAAFKVELPIFG